MSLPNLQRILDKHRISHTGLAVCIGQSPGQVRDLLLRDRRYPSFQFIALTEQLLKDARIPFDPKILWIDRQGRDRRAIQFKPLISLRSVKGKQLPGQWALWNQGIKASALRHGKQVRVKPPKLTVKHRKEFKTMLDPSTLEHFRLDADPFTNEIHTRTDIFWSKDHRATFNIIERAALYSGFVAIIGEVGSGKTLLRRFLIDKYPPSKLRVVNTMNADKANLKAGHILSAIYMDLAGDTLGGNLEVRTRKVHKLLLETARQDQRVVLILEEAHDIPKPTLRVLKRLYDYELGFRRPLAIILLGQTELAPRFNDAGIREISRRCSQKFMRGIKGETEKYLAFKLAHAGAKLDRIFTPGCVKTIEKHCMGSDGDFVSPLTANVLASLAMNNAADINEKRVTPEIIDNVYSPTHIIK